MTKHEPTFAEVVTSFVTTSSKDKEMVEEFARITQEYDEMAKKLESSGIPQRRAVIIQSLINGRVPRRTYAEVGALLGGMSPARVGQIIQAAYRRKLRAETQDAA